MGRRRIDRGSGPNRRGRRPARLPPSDLQRAHRAAGFRARAPGGGVLGSARHFRVPRGPHRAHPVRDARARPPVPPSPRDREALRHARPGEQRARDPRGRGRHVAGGVRPHRCALRRPRAPLRRRAEGVAGVALRRACRSTTARSTTSRGSSSIRVPCRSTCRSGSGDARCARCGARPRSPTAGVRSRSRLRKPPSGCSASTCRRASRWSSRRPRVSTRSTSPRRPRRSSGRPWRFGATIVMSGFASESLAHYLDQLEALAAVHAKL